MVSYLMSHVAATSMTRMPQTVDKQGKLSLLYARHSRKQCEIDTPLQTRLHSIFSCLLRIKKTSCEIENSENRNTPSVFLFFRSECTGWFANYLSILVAMCVLCGHLHPCPHTFKDLAFLRISYNNDLHLERPEVEGMKGKSCQTV